MSDSSDTIEPAGRALGSPNELSASKALQFAATLRSPITKFARLIECRALEDIDVVVFEIDVEVPQIKEYDIRSTERLEALFPRQDLTYPRARALRRSFPHTPHINLEETEFPRSLCLYNQPYEEIRIRWTPTRFLERVRWWLSAAAVGELHAPDQPLEAYVAAHKGNIILPACFRATHEGNFGDFHVVHAEQVAGRVSILVASSRDSLFSDISTIRESSKNRSCELLVLTLPPQIHGVIRARPDTLMVLADTVSSPEFDLLHSLRQTLQDRSDSVDGSAQAIMVLRVPMMREGATTVERVDTLGFMLAGDEGQILKLGKNIGAWDIFQGQRAALLEPNAVPLQHDVGIMLLNAVFDIDQQEARRLNGERHEINERVLAIGVGSLGSYVTAMLARAGFGSEWFLVDHDIFLPHNSARHILPRHMIGWAKSDAVAAMLNVCSVDIVFRSVVQDVLQSGADVPYDKCDIILDMSASLAVARHLAIGVSCAHPRRISIFMNPSGRSLVILAEDKERHSRLDFMEMLYYRFLVSCDRLSDHYAIPPMIQYGQGCSDVTSTIPNCDVATFAATAARALATICADGLPLVRVWQASADGGIEVLDAPMTGEVRVAIRDWEFVIAKDAIREACRWRSHKLPNETGGVLVGAVDTYFRRIYVVTCTPSPDDSSETPTSYTRGRARLAEQMEEIGRRSAHNLEYVGEWHSHPVGCSTRPSADDAVQLAWLAEHMGHAGLPATMLIIGDTGLHVITDCDRSGLFVSSEEMDVHVDA